MYARVSNWTAAMAASLALAALAGCSAPEPDYSAPPPPPADTAYDRAPVDLAGAPPSAPVQDGLAGGPADMAPPAPAGVAMAPSPNPEDLPPAERHRIYGTEYDGDQRVAREDGVAARPQPEPRAKAPARPAPIGARPARPSVVARAPATPVVRPPLAKPVPPITATAKPLDPKLAKLQTALAPQISAGAALTLGAPLNQRLEAPVVLTLPQTLFEAIRQEAAKLGLGRAARVGEVSATLSGEGYEITPNGPQTARLKSGEAASFQWQVKPGAGALGPLRAQIDAVLRGQRTPMTFPLGTITKAAPAPEAAPARFDVRRLDLGEIDVPGIGRMRGETLVGGGLLLLALLLLIVIARNASEAEARARLRRRKARELAEAAAERPVAARPAVKSKASEPKTP
jgi:hypothetical protein